MVYKIAHASQPPGVHSNMAECKAFGCLNNKRKNKDKHFFCVPKPSTPARKNIAKQWLHNIGTGKKVNKFTFGANSVVCEDHFEDSCFDERAALQARLMGWKTRKRLKPDAVPTIFVHRPAKSDTGRKTRLETRNKLKVKSSKILGKIQARRARETRVKYTLI